MVGVPCGCFFRFACPWQGGGWDLNSQSVIAIRRASTLGECACALPVADEAQVHEWPPSQSASELASAARCGNGNRDMFALSFRANPTPATMLCIQFGCHSRNPRCRKASGLFYTHFSQCNFGRCQTQKNTVWTGSELK